MLSGQEAIVPPARFPSIVVDAMREQSLMIALDECALVGDGPLRVAQHDGVGQILRPRADVIGLPIEDAGVVRLRIERVEKVPEMGVAMDDSLAG